MSILAIDQGTTSTRALRIDADGNAEITQIVRHQQYYPQPGWVEHDPEELIASIESCIASCGDARALGIDPLGFRRKNILRDGRPQATGTPMKDAATEAVLERLAKRMNWDAAFDRGQGTLRRGRGIAIGFKASISHTTSVAIVNLFADGSCSLYCNTNYLSTASLNYTNISCGVSKNIHIRYYQA